MNTIRTAVLYPDTLYLHGERGNALAVDRIAKKAGFDSEITRIELGEEFHPLDYDIILVSAGEISRAHSIIEELTPVRGDLRRFISLGRPLVVTGASCAYFGDQISMRSGEIVDGLGIIPATFTENEAVYGDDIWFTTTYNGRDMEIIGNQIQMAELTRSGAKPFGRILYGLGNNEGEDEGIRLQSSIFTNTLGPLLVLNPELTYEIIKTAAVNKEIDREADKIDTSLEDRSKAAKIRYIKDKKSDLKNSAFQKIR